MSNKLSTCADAIRTALAGLVKPGGGGAVKSVVADVLIAGNVTNPPACGVVISRAVRMDKIWSADVLVTVVACKGAAATPEAALCELLKALDDRIAELVANSISGLAPAGVIDRPTWDFWYEPLPAGGLRPVGLIGQIRIRVEDPL